MSVFFVEGLAEREFSTHVIAVPQLLAWAQRVGQPLMTTPPLDDYDFVGVETLLCAIGQDADNGVSPEVVTEVIASDPALANNETLRRFPGGFPQPIGGWLLRSEAQSQWRQLIRQAIAMGKLTLRHFWSKLPITAPAPTVARAPLLSDYPWKNVAHEQATTIIARQKKKDLFPSQQDIADEIARDFRARGVMGTDGKPLSGATIKRHALKGLSSSLLKQVSTQNGRGK